MERSKYDVYACSILPEHVHMVIGRHTQRIEQIVAQLKGAATKQLIAEGIHPMGDRIVPGREPPSPWSRSCWRVFLSTPKDILRAVRYVENNPCKEGKRRQSWRFVQCISDAPTV
ncbi:MAG: transposase [Phycisphaerae bacterium]|nr:transposase [Phycisphaerae bacterium]